jgi:NAD(P)-dependent dehydrogenase (short-subunit alcohol dehydrogenase family)
VGGEQHGAGVAFVTGAGGGIGRAIARALLASGRALALVDRDRDALDAVVEELGGDRSDVLAAWADVTVPSDVAVACARVGDALGPVDTLVCAAGVYGPRAPFVETDPDDWWEVVETNVRGAALCARAVLPAMLERGRGHIVNINSRAAVWDDPAHSSVAYSTSKAGLARFTGALAAEVAGRGVLVVDVSPGMVRTNMTATRPDVAALPDTAFLPASMVAATVVALASDRYPELHGRFVHASDDLDELVAGIRSAPRARMLGLVPTGLDDRVASAMPSATTAVRP